MHATRACLCLFQVVLHAAAAEDATISTNNTRLGTPTYPSNNDTNTHLNTNNTFVSAFTASGSGSSTIIHVVKTISKISPSQPTQRLSITDSTNIFYDDDDVNNAVFSSLSIAATGIHQGNYWTPPPLEEQHHLGESTLMHMMTTTHTPRPEPQQTHGESHLQPNAADTAAVMMLCTMPAHSMLFPPDHNDPLPPPFLTNTIAAASKEQDKSEVPQTTTPIPLSDYAGDLISENTSPYIDGLDDTLALSITSVFDAKQPPPPNFF